ncbi:uncharacterized protein LOC131214002 [Anopheles bellator]|uniref:uncharacterized protein LOC131214002 n=1 Tax=Anopheles bellator TaxID=139047 RepID=UPI0026494AF9|nr:uncharacterized protein LOC131214002 [Anopheles bellator]XP_058064279.1 uncharacterized protein LOC131214002 [Anopheles bellator]
MTTLTDLQQTDMARLVLTYMYSQKMDDLATQFCQRHPYLTRERENLDKKLRMINYSGLTLEECIQKSSADQLKLYRLVEKYGQGAPVLHDPALSLLEKLEYLLEQGSARTLTRMHQPNDTEPQPPATSIRVLEDIYLGNILQDMKANTSKIANANNQTTQSNNRPSEQLVQGQQMLLTDVQQEDDKEVYWILPDPNDDGYQLALALADTVNNRSHTHELTTLPSLQTVDIGTTVNDEGTNNLEMTECNELNFLGLKDNHSSVVSNGGTLPTTVSTQIASELPKETPLAISRMDDQKRNFKHALPEKSNLCFAPTSMSIEKSSRSESRDCIAETAKILPTVSREKRSYVRRLDFDKFSQEPNSIEAFRHTKDVGYDRCHANATDGRLNPNLKASVVSIAPFSISLGDMSMSIKVAPLEPPMPATNVISTNELKTSSAGPDEPHGDAASTAPPVPVLRYRSAEDNAKAMAEWQRIRSVNSNNFDIHLRRTFAEQETQKQEEHRKQLLNRRKYCRKPKLISKPKIVKTHPKRNGKNNGPELTMAQKRGSPRTRKARKNACIVPKSTKLKKQRGILETEKLCNERAQPETSRKTRLSPTPTKRCPTETDAPVKESITNTESSLPVIPAAPSLPAASPYLLMGTIFADQDFDYLNSPYKLDPKTNNPRTPRYLVKEKPCTSSPEQEKPNTTVIETSRTVPNSSIPFDSSTLETSDGISLSMNSPANDSNIVIDNVHLLSNNPTHNYRVSQTHVGSSSKLSTCDLPLQSSSLSVHESNVNSLPNDAIDCLESTTTVGTDSDVPERQMIANNRSNEQRETIFYLPVPRKIAASPSLSVRLEEDTRLTDTQSLKSMVSSKHMENATTQKEDDRNQHNLTMRYSMGETFHFAPINNVASAENPKMGVRKRTLRTHLQGTDPILEVFNGEARFTIACSRLAIHFEQQPMQHPASDR